MQPAPAEAGRPLRPAAFPRVHVLVMILLINVTASVYLVYWLRRTTTLVNQSGPSKPIGGGFKNFASFVVIFCNIAVLAFVARDDVAARNASLQFVGFGALMAIAWAFELRRRLHEVFQISKGDRRWLNGFWTFLFHALYLQHKFNSSPWQTNNRMESP
jgi:hypothetical protein